ncbi:hypothetical protein BGZ49_005856 [Haplosporangium sp. Z 27]|nr:hypothetical protein BGZ49_005856 [Haplosporangium sp. Z 27]
MDDDDLEFESDTEQEYAALSRQRLGKRPAREVDEFDDVEDIEFTVRRGRGGGAAGSSRLDLENDNQQEENDKPTFRQETMQAIFKGVWTDPGTKSQKEALQLSAEYLRLFTIEALHRTVAYQREQEDDDLKNEEILIELDSLEAVIPQLVMDF